MVYAYVDASVVAAQAVRAEQLLLLACFARGAAARVPEWARATATAIARARGCEGKEGEEWEEREEGEAREAREAREEREEREEREARARDSIWQWR